MNSRHFALIGLLLLSVSGELIASDSYSSAHRLYDSLGLHKAVEMYLPSAEKGNGDAAFSLGTMYVFEAETVKGVRGFDQSKVEHLEDSALRWYARAAQLGNNKAKKMIKLVNDYDRGALYISLRYVMNGKKPPPEYDLERYKPRTSGSPQ